MVGKATRPRKAPHDFGSLIKSMKPEETDKLQQEPSPENPPFPVVAIGAAAGGLEAATELLRHLPPLTGAAYVYIQHQGLSADGTVGILLSGHTQLTVQEAEEGMKVAPDHLYIVPPDKNLVLSDGHFSSEAPSSPLCAHLPINRFFMALAESYKEQAMGVLLSGSIADGALGLKSIKLAGGFTFAQDDTALFQTMPKSAVAEGAADLVLPPKKLADELVKLSSRAPVFNKVITELSERALSDGDESLLGILKLLERTTGVAFEQYKMNTIKRRIIRRMMLYKIETAHDYLQYLQQNGNEVLFLYQDLLINVTSFFRDEVTAEYLKKNILPRIIQTKKTNDPIRVWIPACSTGQEAYSLAILIIEALGENPSNIPVQIFATDLSESAVKKARMGLYSKDEVAGVSDKRLQRFFSKTDGHYSISKSIRDLCVFANHNVTKDPPFTRLDLISCCNLMIYLDTPLQKRIIATFHYALNNNGHLVLGKSETVGAMTHLFSQVDKGVKIYARKKEATSRALFDTTYYTPETGRHTAEGSRAQSEKGRRHEVDLDEAMDRLLLKKFTPASVLVNYDLDILQFRGATGLYLEPMPGKASLNLMKMAKTTLGFELRNIVHKAKKTGQAVKKAGLELPTAGKNRRVSIEAIPLKTEGAEEFFLVVFEEMPQLQDDTKAGNVRDARVKQLEAELTALREDVRSILESQEAANEELQSANEEIVSSNEELQSINEELETSKEELESSNEELITINQELQLRNEQLAEAQEYSAVILNTISEAVVVLDKNLLVKSANRAFYKIFAVQEEETEARMIYDLGNRQWDIPKLRELLEAIISNNTEITGYEVTHNFAGIGEKTMRLNARRVIHQISRQEVILLTIQDVTEYKQA
jgi:two-component system CheB/CheR fusion protein